MRKEWLVKNRKVSTDYILRYLDKQLKEEEKREQHRLNLIKNRKSEQ